MTYRVQVGYDEVTSRYFIVSSDIPGLHVETSSFEELIEITRDALPDLVGAEAIGSRITFQRDIEYVG